MKLDYRIEKGNCKGSENGWERQDYATQQSEVRF